MTPLMTTPVSGQAARVDQRLRLLRLLALVDAVLLVALVASAFAGAKNVVHLLGPLHGVNFLILLATAGTAALDGLWGWWFPALILVTAGPIGTLIGDRIITRRGLQADQRAPRALSRASGRGGE